MHLMRERPAATISELSESLGVCPSTVHHHLERLAIGGMAASRFGRWRSWRIIECLRVDGPVTPSAGA